MSKYGISDADQRAKNYYYYGEGKPPASADGLYQCLNTVTKKRRSRKKPYSLKLDDGYLSVSEALRIYRATCFANSRGIILNAMYTINWDKLGINCEKDIHKQIKLTMESLRKFITYKGGTYAALYVHEKARCHGRHAHIFCHVPKKIGNDDMLPEQFLDLLNERFKKYIRLANLPPFDRENTLNLRHNKLEFYPLKEGGFNDENCVRYDSVDHALIGQMNMLSYLLKQINPRSKVPATGSGKKSPLRAREVFFHSKSRYASYEPFSCNQRSYICEGLSARRMRASNFRSKFDKGKREYKQLFDASEFDQFKQRINQRQLDEALQSLLRS